MHHPFNFFIVSLDKTPSNCVASQGSVVESIVTPLNLSDTPLKTPSTLMSIALYLRETISN